MISLNIKKNFTPFLYESEFWKQYCWVIANQVCCKTTVYSLTTDVVIFCFGKDSGSDRLHFHSLVDGHGHRPRYSMASAPLGWVSQIQIIQREKERR